MSNVTVDFNIENKKQVCIICGAEKPLSEFYRRTSNKCGYTRKCKECLDKESKNIPDKQICKSCGAEKLIDQFHKSRFSKTKHSSWCKECIKNKNAEYYRRNAQENTNEVIAQKDELNKHKRCSDCRIIKSKKDFPINRCNKDGHWSFCFDCERLRNEKLYNDVLSLPEDEYVKEMQKRTKNAIKNNGYYKMLVYNHYCGGDIKCADPYGVHGDRPERDMSRLSIDHVNGDGCLDVYPNGQRIAGGALYRKLVKNNYPEGYQILCMSCQWEKRNKNKEYRGGGKGKGKKQQIFRKYRKRNEKEIEYMAITGNKLYKPK